MSKEEVKRQTVSKIVAIEIPKKFDLADQPEKPPNPAPAMVSDFFAEHVNELAALIWLGDDAQATATLATLREKFWASVHGE